MVHWLSLGVDVCLGVGVHVAVFDLVLLLTILRHPLRHSAEEDHWQVDMRQLVVPVLSDVEEVQFLV